MNIDMTNALRKMEEQLKKDMAVKLQKMKEELI